MVGSSAHLSLVARRGRVILCACLPCRPGVAFGWFLKGRYETVHNIYNTLALELARQWTSLDKNHDGLVDQKEFADGVQSAFRKICPWLPAPSQKLTNKLYSAIQTALASIKTLDTNQNGIVEAEELAVAIQAAISSLRSEIGL